MNTFCVIGTPNVMRDEYAPHSDETWVIHRGLGRQKKERQRIRTPRKIRALHFA
jgi:hypothetical protein